MHVRKHAKLKQVLFGGKAAAEIWDSSWRMVTKTRRVATCKPGKPGLTSFSETLALFFIQFLSFRKMKVQDRQNGPSGLSEKTGWLRAWKHLKFNTNSKASSFQKPVVLRSPSVRRTKWIIQLWFWCIFMLSTPRIMNPGEFFESSFCLICKRTARKY